MTKLTNAMIEAAISGFEAQKRHIDTQIAELRAMRTSSPDGPALRKTGREGRRMSAAGRKAMAEAQRKRWAVAKDGAAPKKARRPKRTLSAEGRAAIVAALKKRWAEKKSRNSPTKKKAVQRKNGVGQ